MNMAVRKRPNFPKSFSKLLSKKTTTLILEVSSRKQDNMVFRTGEQGEDGLSPSASVLTFDLLVIMGSTVLLTAESALRF